MVQRVTQNKRGGLIVIGLNEQFKMKNDIKGIRLIADWGSMSELCDDIKPHLLLGI